MYNKLYFDINTAFKIYVKSLKNLFFTLPLRTACYFETPPILPPLDPVLQLVTC